MKFARELAGGRKRKAECTTALGRPFLLGHLSGLPLVTAMDTWQKGGHYLGCSLVLVVLVTRMKFHPSSIVPHPQVVGPTSTKKWSLS